MVIGDDHVETVVAGPIKWVVRADAAVNTYDQLVTFGYCSFERGLLNAVTFGETVWNVKAGAGAEKF